MKIFILFLTLVSFSNLIAQQFYNNFEINNGLEIQIDSTAADTLWEIGAPNKDYLEEV